MVAAVNRVIVLNEGRLTCSTGWNMFYRALKQTLLEDNESALYRRYGYKQGTRTILQVSCVFIKKCIHTVAVGRVKRLLWRKRDT